MKLITCKDFVSLGRHLWRCRERNHHDNGSNDARSSHQRSIVFVQQTDLQSLQTPSNSKIQCACGKEVNSHAGLNRHQRSSRVIMGLNDELSYALQEDNEEIFGDEYRILRENVFRKVYTLLIRNPIFEYLKANDYIECRVQKGFIPKISETTEHAQQLAYIIRHAKSKQ